MAARSTHPAHSARRRVALTMSTVGLVVVACLVPPAAGSTPADATATTPEGSYRGTVHPAEAAPSPTDGLLPAPTGATSTRSDAPGDDGLAEKLRTPQALARPAAPAAPPRAARSRSGASRSTATGPARARAANPPRVDCTRRKCLALTFDDGPVAGTADLLDVLRSRGVHATFFVVGRNARAHPGLLRRMVRDGHDIGNHSLDHADLSRLGASAVRRELAETNRIVRRATGHTPTLVRPPYGATDATVASVSRRLGMALVTWDVDPRDWRDRTTATVRSRVLAAAHPGAIVLAHDIYPTTRAAFARIVDTLLARGYTLVTVRDLLGRARPGTLYTHG